MNGKIGVRLVDLLVHRVDMNHKHVNLVLKVLGWLALGKELQELVYVFALRLAIFTIMKPNHVKNAHKIACIALVKINA